MIYSFEFLTQKCCKGADVDVQTPVLGKKISYIKFSKTTHACIRLYDTRDTVRASLLLHLLDSRRFSLDVTACHVQPRAESP